MVDPTPPQPAATHNLWHHDGDGPLVAAACVAAALACVVLVRLGTDAYWTVLGIARPIAPTLLVVSFGFGGWLLLVRQSWIPARADGLRGFRLAALAGLALPIPVILVDLLGGFGPDLNAAAPDSLLFYPSIAVLAELVFHVTPLAIAALLALVARAAGHALEVIGLIVAAAIEPVLQVLWSTPDSPRWATAYVGLHLIVFNVLGLYLLRRFGLVRVFAFRISYYIIWHIGWGHVRLGLLSSG